MKGTYLLILRLAHHVADLRVGRLGTFSFPAGHYLYVGSAFGPGGLGARLQHHARREKPRPHWHIDYLRECASLIEAWEIGCERPLEGELVQALAELAGISAPVPGFGASDSPHASHLLYSAGRPSHRALTGAVLACAEAAGAYTQQLTIDIHTYDEHSA